ncbi:MAG TPA: hypothetical protein VIV11_40530, partial [Kofleriaceae bacterium]
RLILALAACAYQSRPPAAPPAAQQPTTAPQPAAAAAPADTAPPPDATAPPPAAGTTPTAAPMVPPTVLETRRIKGSKLITPDDMDKHRMAEKGLKRVIATFKLCLAVTGEISSIDLVTSSGIPSYDEKIRRGMSEWRYSPFEINGKPAPVCTQVTFIYNQRSRGLLP